MEPSSSPAAQPPAAGTEGSSSHGDTNSLASVHADAAAYLAKLSAQLEALETSQTALLHSYHATSNALADIRSYNTVAPVMELLPTYTAKVAKLKQVMTQQKVQLERMRVKVEEVRKVKKQNAEMMKKRWEEEKEWDKGLAAKMVDSSTTVDVRSGIVLPGTGGNGEAETGKGKKSVREQLPPLQPVRPEDLVETPLETPGPSTSGSTAAVTKTVVKRKKKARQAEIE
ncbi:hypothetical protein H072_10828 [Dactylellina haptotyla CBS 200.50]|uniref:Biogenesis of lysosome-related organelles complex 1 subunit 6 n=1 Tax=Dactylellina haptotyla (strain CBS 200.50) TaxID=1284197 RepID=S7ZY79_DACHA|nr:hypothetical protein H072_10828 [Dactylellina haptotyla CBS 200.50]